MIVTSLLILAFVESAIICSMVQDTIKVSAPVTTYLVGKTGQKALQSVFRVIDIERGTSGTGFLHESGRVITAAHVVSNPNIEKLKIILANGTQVSVVDVKISSDWDLAVLRPKDEIEAPHLPITRTTEIPIGAQVLTWGFPLGYSGLRPLLTVGYISGVDLVQTDSGKKVQRFVVNAAFNSGNSGGPLIDIEDGSVIGVVSSKLAPVPQYILNALEALRNQQSGFIYTGKTPDGQEFRFTEGQIIGDVLTYLRSQTQLVIGHAVSTAHLIKFLEENVKPEMNKTLD